MANQIPDHFDQMSRDIMTGIGISDWPRADEIQQAYARKLADRAQEAAGFVILFPHTAGKIARTSLLSVLASEGYPDESIYGVNIVFSRSRTEEEAGKQFGKWVDANRTASRFDDKNRTPAQELLHNAANRGLDTAHLVDLPHLEAIQELCAGARGFDEDNLMEALCDPTCWIFEDHDTLSEHIVALRNNPGLPITMLTSRDLLPAIAAGAANGPQSKDLIRVRDLIAKKTGLSNSEVVDRLAQSPFPRATEDRMDRIKLAVHGQPRGADIDDIMHAIERATGMHQDGPRAPGF